MKNKEYNKHHKNTFAIIGKNIKRARGGMSKVELEKKAKVSRNTVWRIERGENITLKNLIKIADVLNVHPSELLLEEKEMNKTRTVESFCRTIVRDEMKEILKDYFKKGS